jgi:hypothetical protein
MAIKYYPNRIQKGMAPAIDRVMAKRKPLSVRGAANVTSTALSQIVSANEDWQLNSIKFTFNNATPRNYSAKIIGGRKVVTDLNDYLWFQTPNTLRQKITLTQGFYTGTTLADELKTKLDANTAFAALGLTFTVAYDAITGLFTITPSSGTIRYWNVNPATTPRYKDSIGGHLFGLTTNASYAGSIISDSACYGLNQEAWIINETASVVTENYFDNITILDVDQAVHLASNTSGVILNWEVSYEEII